MKHSGYQVGIRKKISASPEQVWDCFSAPRGLALWLELPDNLDPRSKEVQILSDGSTIEWVECKECDQLSFKYKLPEWVDYSQVYIRILDHTDICIVHILQENIPDLKIRNDLKNKLEKILIPEFIC